MTNERTILITGASSGIGQAICKKLIQDNHTVIGLARDFNKSDIVDPRFVPVDIDLADLDALPDKLQQIVKDHPIIDGVVCNAGRGQFGSLEEFSFTQVRALIDLNFTSHAYITKTFLPQMKQRQQGNIIFIGSEAALSGSRKGAIYCASKFALRGMAQALREECAKGGVHISIINPGMVKTPFYDELDFTHGEEEVNFIEPEDVANAAALILNSRHGTVLDEINLSPLKNVIKTK